MRSLDDEEATLFVYLGDPIHSGYLLSKREHLANVTRLEHERWKRTRPEFCGKMGIR